MIIFLDQISKYLVRESMVAGEIIKLTPKFFWLTYVQNTGAAFSFSLGNVTLNRIFFIVFTSIAAVFIFFLLIRTKIIAEKWAYALILGGAIGNLIDRILLGSVTDFIWWDFPDFIMQRWPVFNIADSSIVLAMTILIIFYVFFDKKKRRMNK